MAETVIYARISDDREGAGLGVARQEKDCRALAKRLRHRVTRVYTDNDLSAYTGKPRPGYQELLEDIQGGRVGTVLVWHTDRLHRSPRELEDWITLLEQHHVEVRTVVAGDLDLTTASGRMVARMLGAAARHESEHKAERQRAKHAEIANAGRPNGGIRPYGWHHDRVTLDRREHAVIREAADRLLAGESLRSVAADLNSRQIKTVTGKPWNPTVLRAMLTRPRMAGLRAHNGQIIGPATWQPALDEPTWRELCALFNDPARRTGVNTRRYLLTGLARCAECGRPVTLQVGGRNRPESSRVAYGCRACGVWRAQSAVDDYVTDAVLAFLRRLSPEDPTPTAVDPALLERIDRLRQELAELAAAHGDGDISMEQLRTSSRRIRGRLAELEEQAIPPRRRRILHDLTGPAADVAWPGLPLARKRAVIAELLDVRIAKAGEGRRVFRPETVILDWR